MKEGFKHKAMEFRFHSMGKEISAASWAEAQCDKYAARKRYH